MWEAWKEEMEMNSISLFCKGVVSYRFILDIDKDIDYIEIWIKMADWNAPQNRPLQYLTISKMWIQKYQPPNLHQTRRGAQFKAKTKTVDWGKKWDILELNRMVSKVRFLTLPSNSQSWNVNKFPNHQILGEENQGDPYVEND